MTTPLASVRTNEMFIAWYKKKGEKKTNFKYSQKNVGIDSERIETNEKWKEKGWKPFFLCLTGSFFFSSVFYEPFSLHHIRKWLVFFIFSDLKENYWVYIEIIYVKFIHATHTLWCFDVAHNYHVCVLLIYFQTFLLSLTRIQNILPVNLFNEIVHFFFYSVKGTLENFRF